MLNLLQKPTTQSEFLMNKLDFSKKEKLVFMKNKTEKEAVEELDSIVAYNVRLEYQNLYPECFNR